MANVSIDLSSISMSVSKDAFSDVKIDNDMTSILVDKQSVRNCVSNILKWKQCERVLFPEFGNIAHNYLFENISANSFSTIKTAVKNMLSAEPRISVSDIIVRADTDMNEVTIVVSYTIPSIGESDSVSLVVSNG